MVFTRFFLWFLSMFWITWRALHVDKTLPARARFSHACAIVHPFPGSFYLGGIAGVRSLSISLGPASCRLCKNRASILIRVMLYNFLDTHFWHLAKSLRARRFHKPTFRPSGATEPEPWKTTVFRDLPKISRAWISLLISLISSNLLSAVSFCWLVGLTCCIFP